VSTPDGQNARRVTHWTLGRGATNGEIVWSQDGTLMAVRSSIFAVSQSEIEEVRSDAWGTSWGGFSRDGRRLLSGNPIGWFDVVSGEVTELGPGEDAVLSSDGTKIAFVLDGDIHVMSANGVGRTNLTNSSDDDRCPVWSNGGDLVAFESRRTHPHSVEILIARADGSTSWALLPDTPKSGESLCSDWRTGGVWWVRSTPTRPIWSANDRALLIARTFWARMPWQNYTDVYAVAADASWIFNITRLKPGFNASSSTTQDVWGAAWVR
jgi:hypothetical protein